MNIISLNESSFHQYLRKIQTFPILELGEEKELAKQWYEEKNVQAAHKLVTSHLRLVTSIAYKFYNYGISMIELVAEGNIGLMRAVKRFNPTLGFRLATYAKWWIKAAIQEYILKSWSLVKIGTTTEQKKLFFNLRRIRNRLNKYDDTYLQTDEIKQISRELVVSEKAVINIDLSFTKRDRSLNDDVNNDNVVELQDIIESPTSNNEIYYAEKETTLLQKKLLVEAIMQLDVRSRDILINRELRDKPITLISLSRKYKVSSERIRQILQQAIKKVKHYLSTHPV